MTTVVLIVPGLPGEAAWFPIMVGASVFRNAVTAVAGAVASARLGSQSPPEVESGLAA